MTDYTSFSDEELLALLRDGDDRITEYLMEKYKALVKSKASTMFIMGGDREDLIQEGMIGLFKAIDKYDSGRDASFYTFADLCVTREMYKAIEAGNRKKHMPLNRYISLSTEADGDKSSDTPEGIMIEQFASLTDKSPEELVIDREDADRLYAAIESSLSKLESEVLGLHLMGIGYAEIARILGRDEKSTDNALCRIKAKVKKILDRQNE